MDKKLERFKLKTFKLISKSQLILILQFLDLKQSLVCLKLNKNFAVTITQQTWFPCYLKITQEIKKRKNKLTFIDILKDDARFAKNLIKKLRIAHKDAILIFSGYILKDLIEKFGLGSVLQRKPTIKSNPLDNVKIMDRLKRGLTIKKTSVNTSTVDLSIKTPDSVNNPTNFLLGTIPIPTLNSSVNEDNKKIKNQLLLNDKNIASGALYLSYALYSYHNFVKIDLSGNNIDGKGSKLITKSFRYTQEIKTLDLKNNDIGDMGCKSLFYDLLHSRNRLVTIDLSGNNIYPAGLKYIYDYIRYTSSCVSINLENNILGPNGAEIIASALGKNKSLKTFNVSCNGITEKGAKFFVESFTTNKTLQTFYFGSNYLKHTGAKYIADIITTTQTLSYLHLEYNNLSHIGCEAIADALILNISITTIDLHSNNIGDKGVISLFESIRLKSNLISIDLGDNNIKIPGLNIIVDVLKTNEGISYINLEKNKFGVEGGRLIADMLKRNRVIANLNLHNCGIRDGIKFISESLRVNRNLQILNLADNEITSTLFESLSNALKVNIGLKTIYLQMNFLDDKICSGLSEALKINQSLGVINFEKNKISSTGARLLIDALKINRQIYHIDFGENLINDETLAIIEEALKYNKSINNIN